MQFADTNILLYLGPRGLAKHTSWRWHGLVYIDPMSSTHAGLPVQFRPEELSDGVFGYIQPDGRWNL